MLAFTIEVNQVTQLRFTVVLKANMNTTSLAMNIMGLNLIQKSTHIQGFYYELIHNGRYTTIMRSTNKCIHKSGVQRNLIATTYTLLGDVLCYVLLVTVFVFQDVKYY